MALPVHFTSQGWIDFASWFTNKPVLTKIERLIEQIRRDPAGPRIGKQERLRGLHKGWSSVRIDGEHRLTFTIREDVLVIGRCRGHLKNPGTKYAIG